IDNIKPVISGVPTDFTISACTPNASWTTPTPSDNCSIVSFTSNYSPGVAIANGGSITVTYMATDGSGNSISASFTIHRQSALSATASGTNVNCNGGNNGSATVTVSGGK